MERVMQLRQENAQLKEKITCITCGVARRGMIFLPCSHVYCCIACGVKMKYCYCEQYIRATAEIKF